MMTRRHFALASAAALASGAAGSLSAAPIPKDFDTVFPQGPVNPYGKFFTGTSYLTMLNTEPVFNCPIGNVTFEPGCRTFWHKHTGVKSFWFWPEKAFIRNETNRRAASKRAM